MYPFILLTRLAPMALSTPQHLDDLEKKVKAEIERDCPDVRWVANYAILGPYDYLDIFEAPDTTTATRVATIVRSYGHASTEVWAATEWKTFKDLVHKLEERTGESGEGI